MRIAGMVLVAASLALAGCKGPGSVQYANAQVAIFHQRLDAGDYEVIWRESGPDIQNTDKKEFHRLLAAVHDQLGKVRESKQVGWRTDVNTAGSETELTMQTTFERGSRTETFNFRSAGDKVRLAGYEISR